MPEVRFTFPKRFWLRRQTDIQHVYQEGHYQSLGLLSVKYRATEMGYSRFLITVKKRVGPASYRNRLKRLLREAIRLQRPGFEESYDICFFISQPPHYPVRFPYLHQRVQQLFADLGRKTKDSLAEIPFTHA